MTLEIALQLMKENFVSFSMIIVINFQIWLLSIFIILLSSIWIDPYYIRDVVAWLGSFCHVPG